MRGKRLLKAGVSMVMTLAVVAGLVINPASSIRSEASVSDSDEVFFEASAETADSFRPDTVYENLSGNSLKLTTPADAYITPEGYLQINYKSSTTAANDGSYTVWGEGGDFFGGDQKYVKFVLKATEADYASQFMVSFYFEGSAIATYNFDEWLAAGGYTESDIQAAVGSFQTFKLPVSSTNNYKGMKLKFNQGNSKGILIIDSITFGEDSVFDNFDYSTDKRNYYVDEDGNLPMYRPEGSQDGAYYGVNYRNGMMWSASTMQANIVNNTNSGERALQIDYNTDADSYAVLSGSTVINGETMLALTIKGSENAGSCMSVKLMKDGAVVDTISEFTAEPGGSTAVIGSDYSTIYGVISAGVSFDSVKIEFDGSASKGQVFVKDIYFPRYSYTVEHYFDDELDSAKNETYIGLKFGASIDGGYTDYSDTVYSVADVVYSDSSKTIAGSTNTIKVYYNSSVDYTINYYYDSVKDDTKTVTGSDKLGTVVSYTDKCITGYKLDSVSAESITLKDGENVINVYYVKDSFGYTINYYYDGELDEEATVTGTALYQSEVGYEDKNITGYKLDSVSAESITISEDASKNVIDVYYVKDEFDYTINYYYDDVKDDSKTETGKLPYLSELKYTDKNILGYKFLNATAEGIIISEDAAKNVIDVYYAKDSFDYTINYYYDGVIDESLTEEGTALYQSEVKYTDKVKEGYKLDKADPESGAIEISYNVEKNVINVYYVKYSVDYTIEYYYDNVIDSSLTVKGSGLYGDTVTYESQLKDGYKFVKASAEEITLGDDENVIKVYYEKIPVPVTPPATGDTMSAARPLVTMMLCLLVIGAVSVVSVRRRRR